MVPSFQQAVDGKVFPLRQINLHSERSLDDSEDSDDGSSKKKLSAQWCIIDVISPVFIFRVKKATRHDVAALSEADRVLIMQLVKVWNSFMAGNCLKYYKGQTHHCG